MTLSKQTVASRQNGRKSHGPITDEGKAISAQNAVTHGMHATRIIIDSPHFKEDPEQYDLLLASLIWELEPVGVLEHHLVHKIANSLWRYRRVIRAETGCLQSTLDNLSVRSFTRLLDKPDLETDQGRETYQAELDHRRDNFISQSQIPRSADALALLRYEMRLDRQISRAHKLLTRLQRSRRAKESPLKSDAQKMGAPEK